MWGDCRCRFGLIECISICRNHEPDDCAKCPAPSDMTLLSVAVALVTIIDSIGCAGPGEYLHITRTFKSVPAAINYLHASLPDDTPLDEKCKRYAILLSTVSGNTRPHESDAFRASALDSQGLNNEYGRLYIDDVIQSYMVAIERYRIRKLAPPFLELIDCLRQLDVPSVRFYLSNPELNVIITLYKQVVDSPTTKIDLDKLNLNGFNPFFRANLENHFRGNIKSGINDSSAQNISGRDDPFNSETDSSESQLLLADIQQQVKSSIEHYKSRRRERKRLTEMRQRTMNPEAVRERDRRRQRRRRDRLKQRQGDDDGRHENGTQITEHPNVETRDSTIDTPPTSAPSSAKFSTPGYLKTEREARMLRREIRKRELLPIKRQRHSQRLDLERQQQAENLELLKRHNYLQRLFERHQGQLAEQTGAVSSTEWPSPDYNGPKSFEIPSAQSLPFNEPVTPQSQVTDAFRGLPTSLPSPLYNYEFEIDPIYHQDPFDELLTTEPSLELGTRADMEHYMNAISYPTHLYDTDTVVQMLSSQPNASRDERPLGNTQDSSQQDD